MVSSESSPPPFCCCEVVEPCRPNTERGPSSLRRPPTLGALLTELDWEAEEGRRGELIKRRYFPSRVFIYHLSVVHTDQQKKNHTENRTYQVTKYRTQWSRFKISLVLSSVKTLTTKNQGISVSSFVSDDHNFNFISSQVKILRVEKNHSHLSIHHIHYRC